jgi:carboxypeptidase C (cathepsin A)
MAMKWMGMGLAAGLLLGTVSGLAAQDKADKTDKGDTKDKKTEVVVSGTPAVVPDASGASAAPPDSATEGSVTVGGQAIAYKAVAGTITVAGTDAEDAMLGLDGRWLADTGDKIPDKEKPEEAPATARMFYTAYFKQDAKGTKGPGLVNQRPITFIYNGGPGSATMWLHMGSFGPKRVVTPDAEHLRGLRC